MACRALLLASCVCVIASYCSADSPLTWFKDGDLRDNVVPKDDIEAREFAYSTPSTAADVFKRVYFECLQKGSFACVKPKVLAFLSAAMKKESIQLTEDLTIEKTGDFNIEDIKWTADTTIRAEDIIEQVDNFISTHELKLRMPKEVSNGELLAVVPKFLLKNLPTELRLPLTDEKREDSERSFVKKVAIPFLFGLKFKATALIPLALALIALKTWKALTLGLLSIVLSGAILLFKYSKPKAHYEIVHYPTHPHHPPVEHAQPWEHQGYGKARAADAQEIAYSAYKQ